MHIKDMAAESVAKITFPVSAKKESLACEPAFGNNPGGRRNGDVKRRASRNRFWQRFMNCLFLGCNRP
jgi:hypothetical protein